MLAIGLTVPLPLVVMLVGAAYAQKGDVSEAAVIVGPHHNTPRAGADPAGPVAGSTAEE